MLYRIKVEYLIEKYIYITITFVMIYSYLNFKMNKIRSLSKIYYKKIVELFMLFIE